MDVSETQIACLVLGYLKKECDVAYKVFLKNSKHINKKDAQNKYFVTRIFGLSLIDIVQEYVEIYYTIQGRLEATSYFQEKNKKEQLQDKLVDQLVYLLNKIEYSRSSTPCNPQSPIIDENDDDSNSESTPTPTITKEISSTPHNLKKRNLKSPLKHLNKSSDNQQISDVLAQTLLENHELHEKLAETINDVFNSPDKSKNVNNDKNKDGASNEFNETVKTVVRRTEEDPIFEKLIDEIIAITTEGNDEEQQPSHVAETNKSSESKEKTVEDHNNEAIQSIIATSKTVEGSVASQPDTTKIATKNASTTSSEVIVFDGTLDNYIKSTNTCISNTQPNQLFVNTGASLLMMPPTMPTTNYFVVNSQPIVTVPPVLPSIIDHDIMSMPTVIVNDLNGRKINTSKVRPPARRRLKPKTTDKNSAAEFLTNFTSSDNESIITVKSGSSAILSKNITILPTEVPPPPPPPLPPAPTHVTNPVASSTVKKSDSKDKITPSSNIDSVQRVTPKSASHVRNLDFSTPPKVTSTLKKLRRSDENAPVQSAVKTLFKQNSPELVQKSTHVDENKKKKDWDADLRQMIGTVETQTKTQTPKSKKVSPKKKRILTKLKKKKEKRKEKKLNVTEDEGKLLEAALKTPKKTDVVNKEDIILNDFNKSNESIANQVPETSDKELNVSGNKTILSPSKLNVNKRNLVKNVVDKNSSTTPELVISISPCNSMPISRNLTPLLKTPLKTDEIPKTPGLDISNISNFTPFNKVIDEHLQGIDLNSIQTPIFPITPNIPTLTGSGDNLKTPYANRPTDYSTSSSYYQPSDSEQNKSLEQMMIEECNRLEKKSVTPSKDKVHLNVISDVVLQTNKSVINETLRQFHSNIIGKKNLKLLKRTSSSSSSTSSDSSGDSSVESNHNDTVICKKSSTSNENKIRDIINTVKLKETLNKNVKNDKDRLLNELKVKRERTIKKSKTEQQNSLRRSKRRNRGRNGKFYPMNKRVEEKKGSKNEHISSEEDFTLRLSSEDDNTENALKTHNNKSKEIEQIKSPSDLEAENLIHNLKERGIHLIHNKSPKKQLREDNKNNVVNISYDKPNEVLECNKLAKIYDTRTYEGEDLHIVHDERRKPSMKMSDYDLSVLNRELSANVYVEAFDIEVMIPIRVSPFAVLLDISPKLTMKTRSRTENEKKCNKILITDEESNSKDIDDDLMNYALVGNVSSPTTISSPKNSKKRKATTEEPHSEKKSKTENCEDIAILKGINVDVFLNKVHGNH